MVYNMLIKITNYKPAVNIMHEQDNLHASL